MAHTIYIALDSAYASLFESVAHSQTLLDNDTWSIHSWDFLLSTNTPGTSTSSFDSVVPRQLGYVSCIKLSQLAVTSWLSQAIPHVIDL